MNEISVNDLARWRNEGKNFVLLDVRNSDEIAAVALTPNTHIPMHEIPQRAHELPNDVPIAVICHHGGRSERVAAFLAARGLDAHNVSGGIDAYARSVDPKLPRY